MRVIKLSPADPDMTSRDKVDWFFRQHLAQRNPKGQFLLTKGRIAKDGISEGELLVFSYEGDIVFLGIAATSRQNTSGPDAVRYPHYFCVDVDSIKSGLGRLSDFESLLRSAGLFDGNLVRAQGWPTIDESGDRRMGMDKVLEQFSVLS